MPCQAWKLGEVGSTHARTHAISYLSLDLLVVGGLVIGVEGVAEHLNLIFAAFRLRFAAVIFPAIALGGCVPISVHTALSIATCRVRSCACREGGMRACTYTARHTVRVQQKPDLMVVALRLSVAVMALSTIALGGCIPTTTIHTAVSTATCRVHSCDV